jgi:hypothetical protein
MSRLIEVRGAGSSYAMPSPSVLDARMTAAARPGEHLWVIAAVWQVADPERTGPGLLDAENLLVITGPGCFKCEKQYSRKLARQRCAGSTA